MSSRKSTKKLRSENNISSGDEQDERLSFFIPDKGIDIEVLAFYVTRIIDKHAQIKVEKKDKVGTAEPLTDSNTKEIVGEVWVSNLV